MCLRFTYFISKLIQVIIIFINLNTVIKMLQIEDESDQVSKSVVISEVPPTASSQKGYVNNAFEDVPQIAEKKVNDKHNVSY